MPGKSATKQDKRQLSRTKVGLYLECPRCFVLDVKHGVPRVSGYPMTLNIAVDALLKKEFDHYRISGKPHPEFKKYGIDALPYNGPEFKGWQTTRKGVRWASKKHGWTFYGIVDDIWITPSKSLIVADYKATAKKAKVTAETVLPVFKKQLEFYQFLLRQLGYNVEDRAWLVYANGIAAKSRFQSRLDFDTRFIPMECSDSWVMETLNGMLRALKASSLPDAGRDCKWCAYHGARDSVG